jgi:PhnB protein
LRARGAWAKNLEASGDADGRLEGMTMHAHLIVKDAPRAIDFYVKALGAKEVARHADPNFGGRIVHATLSVADSTFTLAEEARDWHNHAPTSLGGTPVILMLQVDDPDALGKRMEDAGAKVVFPIADQFYGRREGRFVDPFGHMWIVGGLIEELSHEEIQRRVDRQAWKEK